MDDATAYERQDATFVANLTGAAPMTYQWFRMYPWETNWVQVAGATNSTFTISNVDSWVDFTEVTCLVSNGNGERRWLGSAALDVWPVFTSIPSSGFSGPASRYPTTINVFGQTTNFNNVKVTVTVWGLTHTRSADLSLLVVSPSGKGIMLMSNVGGTNTVLGGVLQFIQGASLPQQAAAIPSGGPWPFGPSNYRQVTQMPQVGADPPPSTVSANLDDLQFDNPNGQWKLYIYDSVAPGGAGQLTDSWFLRFNFQ